MLWIRRQIDFLQELELINIIFLFAFVLHGDVSLIPGVSSFRTNVHETGSGYLHACTACIGMHKCELLRVVPNAVVVANFGRFSAYSAMGNTVRRDVWIAWRVGPGPPGGLEDRLESREVCLESRFRAIRFRQDHYQNRWDQCQVVRRESLGLR